MISASTYLMAGIVAWLVWIIVHWIPFVGYPAEDYDRSVRMYARIGIRVRTPSSTACRVLMSVVAGAVPGFFMAAFLTNQGTQPFDVWLCTALLIALYVLYRGVFDSFR